MFIKLLNALSVIDTGFLSTATDKTVSKPLEKIFTEFSDELILSFANGGDQNNESIPEANVCKDKGIGLIDGLGDKIQSSSWLLKK